MAILMSLASIKNQQKTKHCLTVSESIKYQIEINSEKIINIVQFNLSVILIE